MAGLDGEKHHLKEQRRKAEIAVERNGVSSHGLPRLLGQEAFKDAFQSRVSLSEMAISLRANLLCVLSQCQ